MVGAVSRYLRQLRSFSSNARFYLLSELITSLAFSIYMLVFNLYVVSQDYPRSYLGMLLALPNLIALFGAVPSGMLADYIGRKRTLFLANAGQTLATLGIVVAPGQVWLALSMILFGVSTSLWMVVSSPFMMENSEEEERDALFSAHFGLTTLIGFIGTLIAGFLPSLFGDLMGVGIESAAAYRATLAVTVVLSALSLAPIVVIRERSRGQEVKAASVLPWRNLSDPGMAVRVFLPNLVISLGAAILIPYMNLFFKESFAVSDRTLGTVFAVSSVVTGTATLASPLLAQRWGRIRSLVFTQLASIPFLLTIGFAPALGMAVMAFWIRAALMNMGGPLYEAFAMEQFKERERATISGLMGMSWNIGWTIGPWLSGYMQANPNIGFQPIFVITCSFYIVAAILSKVFFQRLDDRQRRTTMLKKTGVVDLTPERLA
jgi:MFS family permease